METNLLLKTYLKRLKLPAMAREVDKVVAEASTANLPYDRFLLALAEHEVLAREQNTLRQRIRRAGFPVLKTIDSYDFTLIPTLPKVEVLHLAECRYIGEARNVCLIGNPGTGKTHLGIGLGIAACRHGYHVRFFTAAGLVNQMIEARAEHRLSRFERQLSKADLVVLDELGYVPFTREAADLLFGFCSDRYERASLLVTSNLEFEQWGEVFGDARLTGALVDRLTHRAAILPMVGESIRFRQAQARQQGAPVLAEAPMLTIEQITPAATADPVRPPGHRRRIRRATDAATAPSTADGAVEASTGLGKATGAIAAGIAPDQVPT